MIQTNMYFMESSDYTQFSLRHKSLLKDYLARENYNFGRFVSHFNDKIIPQKCSL